MDWQTIASKGAAPCTSYYYESDAGSTAIEAKRSC